MHHVSRRRTIYRIAISLALPTLALTWWLHQAHDPLLRYRTPLLGAWLLWALFALHRSVAAVPRVERVTFWFLTVAWLGSYVASLYGAPVLQDAWAQILASVMLNFFVLAVLAHLVFTTRVGLRVNLLLLGIVGLAGLGRFLPDMLQSGIQREMAWFVQFEIAFAVIVGLAYALAKSKDDHLEAELRAKELGVIANHDPLTGLPNRRRLTAELERQVDISQRYGRALSLISFDLDHFKRINDRHGHPVGDEVLRSVAGVVAPFLRSSDTFGRWGGEEFLIVAPETGQAEAEALAERLRCALETANHPAGVSVTASFGVIARAPGMGRAEMLSQADAKLYVAKGEGRNRVARRLTVAEI